MQKLIVCLIAIAIFLGFALTTHGQVVYPNRGGTGATTIPTYGQILVGNALGTFTLTATSSLGISAGTSAFSTTSSDYWDTTKWRWSTTSSAYFLSINTGAAFSTSSAAYFLSQNQGAAFSTTSANYWSGLGYGWSTTSANAYLNATSTFSTTSANAWLATKSTTNLTEGSNLYFTDTRVRTYLDTLGKGYFFSSTSADHWLTIRQGAAFSTTSANFWASLGYGFSTTSANAWSALGYGFSTTSANAHLNGTSTFSTTSANAWLNASSTQSLPSCSIGQIIEWSGTRWNCGTDDSGGGGGESLWSRTALNGTIYAPTTTDSVVIRGTATSTPTSLQVYGTSTASAFNAASSTATSTLAGVDILSGLFDIRGWTVSTSTTVCAMGCEYSSIQTALTGNWRPINVRTGTFSEQLTIQNTKTKLTGESLLSIVQGNGVTQSPVISANAKDETFIEGLTVSEINAAPVGDMIDFSNVALARLIFSRINNGATSTAFRDTASNTFYNLLLGNTFFNCGDACLEFSGTQANANTSAFNRYRRNCSPSYAGRAKDRFCRVRRIASRAEIERRLAVSRVERMSA